MRRVALITAALLLFAACGDDGAASLEDYFGELETAGIAYDEASAPVDAALSDSSDPLTDVKAAFPVFVDDLSTFVGTLDAMKPPAEVAEVHASTVVHGKAVLAAFQAVVTELDAVDDMGGLIALFEGPTMARVSEAGDLFSDGCSKLQAVADDNGIDVDLRCG